MDLVTPDLGLSVWTTIAFLILLFLLKKFAWKPILNSVNERENRIKEALSSAKKAEKKMEEAKFKYDEVLQQARKEKNNIIKKGNQMKETILSEAKNKAIKDAEKIVQQARKTIELEKRKALSEIKNSIVNLSINITEKILRKEMEFDKNQKEHMQKLIDEIS